MNKEELKKQAFDYNSKLKSHPMSEQDLQDILCDFAEQYAQSQTEALKKEIEELKGKTEWVSVEERLPKCHSQHRNDYSSGYVLIYTKYGEIEVSELWNDKEWSIDTNGEDNYVTHWMPLPTPPNQ